MKVLLSYLVFILLSLSFRTQHARAQGPELDLNPSQWKEIPFEKKEPTLYSYDQKVLTCRVQSSAKALIFPFQKMKQPKQLQWSWSLEGNMKTESVEQEQSKSGDDFPLRVGLILSGEEPFIPFFAPTWIKMIRSALTLPSDKMVYYVAGSKAKPGTEWKSPYSKGISMKAVDSVPQQNGWFHVSQDVEGSKVVGIWLMADGDDSKSSFVVKVKDLVLL